MTRTQVIATVLFSAVAMSLCACKEVVGEGQEMTGINVVYNGEESYATYECTSLQLTALGTFLEDGEETQSDFTGRASWTSSNPAVIGITSGGVAIARAPGSAVIRAQFLDFVDTFTLSATEIFDLHIEPELTQLAPDSKQTFSLKAQLIEDSAEVDLTASANWLLPSSSSPGSLSGSTLTVNSRPSEQLFPLEAELATCGREVVRELRVGTVASLEILTEQAEDLPIPLSLTEAIRVIAHFVDDTAPVQNLSTQLTIDYLEGTEEEASLEPAADSVYGNDMLILTGLQEDEEIQFELTYEGTDTSVQTRIYVFDEDLELESFRIDPVESFLTYPETSQINAYGVYSDGYERPITRAVTMTSQDTDIITVISRTNNAGRVTTVGGNGRGTVRVTTTIDEETESLYSDFEVEVDSP